MEKSTSHRNAFVLAEMVEDSLIDTLQVAYDAATEGLKTPLFNLVRTVVEIIQQENMDSRLLTNIETLKQSESDMDAATRPMTRCQSLITPTPVDVKRHIDEIEEEHHLLQSLPQEFSETTHQSRSQRQG